MALVHLSVGFLGVSLLGVICGFQWDPLPDPVLYSCVEKGVTFSWAFQTDQGEKVGDIHWVFDGAFSSQLVATMTYEYFLPTEIYSQRVRYVKNGGFSLHDVTFADSGNYTVEIDVLNKDGSFVSHRHSVYLQVADGLMTRDRKLTVEQDPLALWDDHTQQWVIRLNCGSFTYLGQPPLHVIWTNSKGETQSSTGYDNGNFFLTLRSPVQGGNYTCHIPAHLLSDACVSDLDGDGEDTIKAGVTVDEVKARLTLMEAEQKTIKKDNTKLKEDNSRLKEQLSKVKDSHSDVASEFMEHINNLTDFIEETKATCDRRTHTLHSVQQSIQDDVQALWNITMDPCRFIEYKVLDDITRSVDNGYEAKCDNRLSPGWYRFFLTGADAVIPTSCVPVKHCGTHVSVWLDLQGAALPEVGQEQAARACGHYSGNCCYKQKPATVRNCGTFFLYKLTPIGYCNDRFCAELKRN